MSKKTYGPHLAEGRAWRENMANLKLDKDNQRTDFSMTIPIKYRPLYIRCISNDASPRQAIKAMCQHCCGYEDLNNRVGNCSVLKCPLWSFRPYQKEALKP